VEKLLPQNVEAECGVLGSIIIDPEAVTQVSDWLRPADFYRNAHRDIYEAIIALTERRIPADIITLCDEMERRGKLEEVGGVNYLSSLVNQVPTSGNAHFYGKIIKRTATLRRMIHAAGQIAALAYEDGIEEQAALDKAEQLLYAIRQRQTQRGLVDLREIMAACLADIDLSYQNRHMEVGVPTGFRDLDDALGLLQRTDLILLAGRPGSGKTSLGMNIAYNAAKRDKAVAAFSLEMGGKQLGNRLISRLTAIPTQRLRNGWIAEHEWDAIVAAQDYLSTLPIAIDDTAAVPILSIRNQIRMLENRWRRKVDLIVVDYLQLIDESDGSYAHRVQEIDKISRGLKQLAKDFDVPVLALAQLSRKVEERSVKIPQLADLRESGALEQDADIVLFVYRDDCYAGVDEDGKSKSTRPGIADILIAKHRNGDTGEIQLRFIGARTSFYNVYEEVPPSELPLLVAGGAADE
jgi:replicative DNA helicase